MNTYAAMVDLVLMNSNLGVLRNDVVVVSGVLRSLGRRADVTSTAALRATMMSVSVNEALRVRSTVHRQIQTS